MSCGRLTRVLRAPHSMGKTCVCAALALATRHKGKTIVLVNNTLVGQWCDEIRKFAPRLRLYKLYGGTPNMNLLQNADIVVTTPHSKPPKGVPPRTAPDRVFGPPCAAARPDRVEEALASDRHGPQLPAADSRYSCGPWRLVAHTRLPPDTLAARILEQAQQPQRLSLLGNNCWAFAAGVISIAEQD